jgi:hypothetical protein
MHYSVTHLFKFRVLSTDRVDGEFMASLNSDRWGGGGHTFHRLFYLFRQTSKLIHAAINSTGQHDAC